MSIQIHISGDTAEEVFTQLKGLVGFVPQPMTEEEHRAIRNFASQKADDAAREALQAARTSATKAARKPKAEKPVDEGNEPAPSAETTTEATHAEPEEATTAGTSTSDAPAAAAELNYETDVAPKVLAAVARAGKPAVEALFEEYGIARASQLDAARWPELIERLGDL
jgi:hypothetical protein